MYLYKSLKNKLATYSVDINLYKNIKALFKSSDHWHHYSIALGPDPENAHIVSLTGFSYDSWHREEQIAVQICTSLRDQSATLVLCREFSLC